MPECRKHIFLVPLKTINEDFLDEIKSLDKYSSERFTFLLSIQDYNSYNKVIESGQLSESVILIRPDKYYERTQHWEYIVRYAHAHFSFDSFSYYFFGDMIRLNSFPELQGYNDIYINDYYIDSWERVKENTSSNSIVNKSAKDIIRKNLIAGRPLLAPLQKIIFPRKVATQLIFDSKNSYVCDQLMMHMLISHGNNVVFIKSPFYKINNKNRSFSGTIGVADIIKQQCYLYIKLRCFIGIPMIISRTLIKFFLKIN
ncbi:MAG: hypothetical protein E6017_17060 [Kluyvera cryocrescens]|nr:hypothetical protein [Kluyvera cryocrescens]